MSTEANYDQRTREYFQDLGWEIGKVQYYNRYSGKSNDLFGWVDFVAMSNKQIVGVQSTSWAQRKVHIDKFKDPGITKRILRWVHNGGDALLICWRKQKIIRGGTAFKYVPVVESLKDLVSPLQLLS